MATRKSAVTFGKMEGRPERKKQKIFLAGTEVGTIRSTTKQDWTVHGVTFLVVDYTVDLMVDTVNGSDSFEIFRVKTYGSARSALAAAQQYAREALGG